MLKKIYNRHGSYVIFSNSFSSVYMWTEDQVRLWHHLCAKDIAYLDATGTIVRDFMGKGVLYYAIVVRHPKERNPPMPVAEMITNDHSAH
jgi:hypothetical protein